MESASRKHSDTAGRSGCFAVPARSQGNLNNNFMKALITRKLGMMSIMDRDGRLIPLTILKVEPNFVSQVKTGEKDGYDAVQIASIESRKVAKPQLGHLKKAKLKQAFKVVCELRLKESSEEWQTGKEVPLGDFATGDTVEATGTSKGKGFAGSIKRHNFSRQPKTHGGKGDTRRPGSIGSAFPQKVFKGKKMAGRLGGKRATVKGLSIGLVDEKRRLLGIRGAVPGPRRGLVIIRKKT